MVKIITANILFELADWEQRRELLLEGLAAEQADLIAIQESNLTEDTGAWLAEKLEMPYVHTVPFQKTSPDDISYGIAILSRYPFVRQLSLDLQGQGRFAQYVETVIADQSFVLCNGHYYWYPDTHPERDAQVQRLLDWLGHLPPKMPVIAVGDFNGTPETSAIALMRDRFTSAYAAHHGKEPDYTCPTPLARRGKGKLLRHFWRNLLFNRTLIPWKGTLDYIFVNQQVRVKDCRLILTKPATKLVGRSNLYPSDHFGIVADLEILPKAFT
jgi:endonuclease/exonuclease/phosphatase family metal-dependent hydrolase